MISSAAPGGRCGVGARLRLLEGKRQGSAHDLLTGGVADRHLEVGVVAIVADVLRGDSRKSLHDLSAHLVGPIELRPVVVADDAIAVPKLEEVSRHQAA